LESSGPVFIKLAQWLSTRRDVLDAELCKGMAILHERVSTVASLEDHQRAESAVPGLRVKNLLGGGCIALVFQGELDVRDGAGSQAVAVKVRRKGVEKLMHTDIKLMRLVARIAETLNPSLQWLAMPQTVDNFGGYLIQQMNLTIEADHLRQFDSNFQGLPTIGVPRVHVATEGVLVTEIAEGVSLSKFVHEDHSHPVRQAVFEALTDLMARMVLVDDFIHGDLHPGNLFVSAEETHSETNATSLPMHFFHKTPTYKITLIDAGIAIGMTKNLTRMMRDSMRAAFNMNSTGLGHAIVQLHMDEGLCAHAEDLHGLENVLGKMMLAGAFMCRDRQIWGAVFSSWKEYRSSHVSDYFGHMLNLLSKHKVRISPSLWSIMTALALIEGSIQELGFGVNVLRSATPYLFQGRFERLRRRRHIEQSELLHQQEEL